MTVAGPAATIDDGVAGKHPARPRYRAGAGSDSKGWPGEGNSATVQTGGPGVNACMATVAASASSHRPGMRRKGLYFGDGAKPPNLALKAALGPSQQNAGGHKNEHRQGKPQTDGAVPVEARSMAEFLLDVPATAGCRHLPRRPGHGHLKAEYPAEQQEKSACAYDQPSRRFAEKAWCGTAEGSETTRRVGKNAKFKRAG